jgi:DNA-binding FadR family transcriptional regulator
MWKPKERLRVAKEVTEQLRTMILTHQVRPGEKLPPERKLAETLGVNRATLREAMKNLEQAGLIHIRQGDGTRVLDFVQTAGLDLLRHLVPHGDRAGLGIVHDILEFRQIVGREVARLAAERAGPGELARLREIAWRETASPEQTLLQDLDFYVELARATRNLVFSLLLNTVAGTARSLSSLIVEVIPPEAEVRLHHQAVISAIEARDPEAACHAADRHLCRGKEHLLRRLEGPEIRVSATASAIEAPR